MARPSRPERQILQAPRFAKAKRRLPEQAQLAVDEAVRGILADPLSGEPKVGALKDVRVVKFKVATQQLLLAYQFDPEGKDPALRQMVVIGHSQGGLLTKLTVINSGTKFWDNISKKPLDELKLKPETRELIRHSMFVTPLPFVRQVIFISTPQRGSFVSEGRIARWLADMVKLPGTLLSSGLDIAQAMAESEPDKAALFRDLPKSVDNMNPSNPFMRTLASIRVDPPVTAHSIIPVLGNKPREEDDDGVVKYSSAHIEEAVSEKVIKSGHSVQGNPEAIEEVRRILLEHAGVH